jgi:hypothetical protein
MFISDAILEKFSNLESIIIFNNQKQYPCQSVLAKLYQAIMKNEKPERLKEIFLSLDSEDRKLILEIIESKTHSSLQCQSAHHSSGMEPLSTIQIQKAFANLDHFYLAVQESILKKLDSLSIEEKEKVYEKIYKLAGSPATGWKKTLIVENIPRLADVLAER